MLFITIWPLFALICLGFVLARKGFPDAGFWPAAERINYFLLFPALLVSSLVDAPLGDPQILRLGAAALVTILLASLGLALARRIFPAPSARFGPALQGTVRFNTYLGLAVTASLAGDVGIERAAVYLAICVPVVNVLSIMALSEREVLTRPGALFRTMLKQPVDPGLYCGDRTGTGRAWACPLASALFWNCSPAAACPWACSASARRCSRARWGATGWSWAATPPCACWAMPLLAAGVALVLWPRTGWRRWCWWSFPPSPRRPRPIS